MKRQCGLKKTKKNNNTCIIVNFILLTFLEKRRMQPFACFGQKGVISTLSDNPLKLVDQFTYFGSNIHQQGVNMPSKGMECYRQVINHMEV